MNTSTQPMPQTPETVDAEFKPPIESLVFLDYDGVEGSMSIDSEGDMLVTARAGARDQVIGIRITEAAKIAEWMKKVAALKLEPPKRDIPLHLQTPAVDPAEQQILDILADRGIKAAAKGKAFRKVVEKLIAGGDKLESVLAVLPTIDPLNLTPTFDTLKSNLSILEPQQAFEFLNTAFTKTEIEVIAKVIDVDIRPPSAPTVAQIKEQRRLKKAENTPAPGVSTDGISKHRFQAKPGQQATPVDPKEAAEKTPDASVDSTSTKPNESPANPEPDTDPEPNAESTTGD